MSCRSRVTDNGLVIGAGGGCSLSDVVQTVIVMVGACHLLWVVGTRGARRPWLVGTCGLLLLVGCGTGGG